MQIKPETSPHVLIFSPALDRWDAFNAHLMTWAIQLTPTPSLEGFHRFQGRIHPQAL